MSICSTPLIAPDQPAKTGQADQVGAKAEIRDDIRRRAQSAVSGRHIETVVTAAAECRHPAIAGQREKIIARPAVQGIIPGLREQPVIAVAAEQRIIARRSGQQIGPTKPSQDEIVVVQRCQRVRIIAAVQDCCHRSTPARRP